jgi:hypothetical protein
MRTNEFNALSDMIKISNRALLAKADADMSVLNHSITELTSEIKKHNGRLLTLENCHKDNEHYFAALRWMRKKWILVMFIGMLIFYGLLTLYETGLFIDIIKFMGGKI